MRSRGGPTRKHNSIKLLTREGRSLPIAAHAAQGVISDIQSVQARAATNQPLDGSHLLDLVACQIQILKLLQGCHWADIDNVAVLHS